MGFRKVSGKKYNSIYEYYKDSDHDKKTIAYYIMYRDLENKPKKIKCDGGYIVISCDSTITIPIEIANIKRIQIKFTIYLWEE